MRSHSNGILKMVNMYLTKEIKCDYHLHMSLSFLFQEFFRQESKAKKSWYYLCSHITILKFANIM